MERDASAINLGKIRFLSFDCYGTLIDWETGILACLQPILATHGVRVEPSEILQQYVRHEVELEAGSWRPYREILAAVCERTLRQFNVSLTQNEYQRLPDSLGSWPPFPDTIESLKRLKRQFGLVILSNTDDDLFALTSNRLSVPFDSVITAEQLHSYKPANAHFEEALKRLNASTSEILHVAQSSYHDHVTARSMGFQTAWIRRPGILKGTGLAPAANAEPTFAFDTLAELAKKLCEK